MAVTVREHTAAVARQSDASRSIDLRKLIVWIAAVIVPWAAIIITGRIVIATVG